MVGQSMGVGVDDLHGRLLVGRRFVVGIEVLVLLVVEAAVPFHGAAPPTRVPPAGRAVLSMARRAMVGHRKAKTRTWWRLRRKVARGWDWGSAPGPPRRRGHGLAYYGGVGHVGSRCCGGLRQLSAAAAWRAGPRG